jgi:hypothetical protein
MDTNSDIQVVENAVVTTGDKPEVVVAAPESLESLADKIVDAGQQIQVVSVDRAKTGEEKEAKEEMVDHVARIPNPSCKYCYGRGHLGKDLKSGRYVHCRCVMTKEERKSRRA